MNVQEVKIVQQNFVVVVSADNLKIAIDLQSLNVIVVAK